MIWYEGHDGGGPGGQGAQAGQGDEDPQSFQGIHLFYIAHKNIKRFSFKFTLTFSAFLYSLKWCVIL